MEQPGKNFQEEDLFRIVLTANDLQIITPILQKGFQIHELTDISLNHLLKTRWNLTDDFIRERIGTIFLDSKPVDDLDRTVIRSGAVLALSAAMPGLVGAVMRRGSPLAVFRDTISCVDETACISESNGTITIKLFNTLMKDLGPMFLKNGMIVDIKDLDSLSRDLSLDIPDTSSRVLLVSN